VTPLVRNINCGVVLCFLYKPQVGEKEMFGFFYYWKYIERQNVQKALERAMERSRNVYDICRKQHDCNRQKIWTFLDFWKLWDPPRLLSAGIRGHFQEGNVDVVQGWGSECMEQCQYSPYMPSRHGQGQLDFHNFYLSTYSVMWLYRCETFTVQKSNGNAFWLGAFLKSGVLEDLSAINCEDGMWN